MINELKFFESRYLRKGYSGEVFYISDFEEIVALLCCGFLIVGLRKELALPKVGYEFLFPSTDELIRTSIQFYNGNLYLNEQTFFDIRSDLKKYIKALFKREKMLQEMLKEAQ